jgi:hypothetical protein
LHFAQLELDRPIRRLSRIAQQISAIWDLNVFADAERRADLRDKLAVDVVDPDLARRWLTAACPVIENAIDFMQLVVGNASA